MSDWKKYTGSYHNNSKHAWLMFKRGLHIICNKAPNLSPSLHMSAPILKK